ncbi:MAG: nuclear transport factor 2 family protein [Steroidobacteraceae bacterium]|jgi:ketosteroid isomerase-like protein
MSPNALRVHLSAVLWMSFLSGCVTTGTSGLAQTEVLAALAEMGAAANAHDVDRHVGFYAHDASTTLIFNGESVVGWEAIRAKQREWWGDGKTDVVYTVQGKPEVRMLKADLAVTTLFMRSRRTGPNGEVKDGRFAVSALWQRRAEGWRVIYSHESTTH